MRKATSMGLLFRYIALNLTALTILGFSGARYSEAQSTLLVNSSNTHSVLSYEGTSGAPISSFTPINASGLSQPRGLAFGPDGNLYVSSRATHSILRYDGMTGAFIDAFIADDPTTQLNEAGGLNEPIGLTFGPDSNLYVSSGGTHSIFRYDSTTATLIDIFVPPRSGGLDTPRGLAFGPDGDLYVSSSNNNSILRYNGTSGVFINAFVTDDPSTPGNETGDLQNPVGLTFSPTGDLFICSFNTNSILQYNGTTGAFISAFVINGPSTPAMDESGGLDGPIAPLFGPDGNLYITSFLTNRILRYDGTTGAFIDDFVTDNLATANIDETGGLNRPTELFFGPDSNLYISSRETNSILRYNGTTGAFIDTPVLPLNGNLLNPIGLAIGPDGNLYVSSFETDSVLRYNGITGAFIDTFVTDLAHTTMINESGGLREPTGLTFGSDGSLYVSSFRTDRILKYDGTTGAFMTIFVSPQQGGLIKPTGLVFGPDNNLYVNSFETHSTLRYNGILGTFINTFAADDPMTPAVDESGGLQNPIGLTFGPAGDLYVSSFSTNAIFRYNGTTGIVISEFVTDDPTTPAIDESGGLQSPTWLTFGPDGNLYASSRDNHQVLRYDGVTGAFIDAFIPPGSGGLSRPTGLIFIP